MRLKTFTEICIILATLGLQIQLWYGGLWYGGGGFAQIIHLKAEQEKSGQVLAQLEQKNEVLTREIIGLQYDKNLIEAYMRYQLGVIKSGETFFLIAD